METKLMRVTQPMARDWLKRNTGNRPIRRTKVEGLKTAFQRGEYIPTHQGIAFLTDGTVADGQHRLIAISEMPEGFSVEMLVTRGLEAGAFQVIDIGSVRSTADILRKPQGLAAVANYMAKIIETQKMSITPTFIMPFISAVEYEYENLTDYCSKISRTWSAASIRTAAILRMISGGDRDYVLLSYHALNHDDFDAMSPVVKALYRQQTRGAINSKSLDIFARAYRAFDWKRQSTPTIQISNQAGIIEEAREVINTRVLGQKKAPQSRANKVNKGHSTRVAA